MKKAYLILLVALPLICACSETFTPTIQITPSLSNVPYTGGSVDLKIMTDLPWKVVMEEGCNATVSKTNGAGDDMVTITVPATDNWTTTCIKVQLYCRSNSNNYSSKYAYITQGYKPHVSVSAEAGTIPAEGGMAKAIVTANGPWKASCNTAGVTVQPDSGITGNETVSIYIPANPTNVAREITINFSIDGDSDVLVLNQAG